MTRFKPSQRRAQLIAAGAELVENVNLYKVTLSTLAIACDCSGGTVAHYFGSLDGWRDAVIADAIQYERLKVIAQAVVARDPAALALSTDLITRALMSQVNT